MNLKITRKQPKTSISFDTSKRFNIRKKNPQLNPNLYDRLEVIYLNNISEQIKSATDRGIEEVFQAGNFSLNKTTKNITIEELLTETGCPNNYDFDMLMEQLSVQGHDENTYKLLVGNYLNTAGKNGGQTGVAAAVSGPFTQQQHKMLTAHELGHMFKAATGKYRTNLDHLSLGSHCLDNKITYENNLKQIIKTPCIMRQEMTNEHFDVLEKVGSIFCPNCITDIKEYVLRK